MMITGILSSFLENLSYAVDFSVCAYRRNCEDVYVIEGLHVYRIKPVNGIIVYENMI